MEFKLWLNENWMSVEQIAKYLPLAMKEIENNPELMSLVKKKSLFQGLHYAIKKVTNPEFLAIINRVADQDVAELPLQELIQIEILVRKKILPAWKLFIKALELLHITQLITHAVPKFQEFLDHLFKIESGDFKNNIKKACVSFLQFIHHVSSSTLISGLAAKIFAVFGFIGIAWDVTVLALVIWILLLILGSLKSKIRTDSGIARFIGLIIKIFSPHEDK